MWQPLRPSLQIREGTLCLVAKELNKQVVCQIVSLICIFYLNVAASATVSADPERQTGGERVKPAGGDERANKPPRVQAGHDTDALASTSIKGSVVRRRQNTVNVCTARHCRIEKTHPIGQLIDWGMGGKKGALLPFVSVT